ncbi:MAG: cation diffusion facilitator family transporter [Cytophagaceae bacterium]
MSKYKIAVRTTLTSIISSLILASIKGLTGYFGNSFALIADSIESLTDVFTSVLVLIGLWYANKPPDKNHPYGHGRIEPLVTFLIVGFLIVSATLIGLESIRRINTPHELPKKFTLVVLAIIICWKEISYQYVIRKSKQIGSSSLKADAWHHRSDAITSVAAFIGITIAVVMGEGYETADDWAALFAAGFILYNAFLIFRPALGEIMDEHLYDDLKDEIKKISLTVNGVLDVEKCYIRKTGMTFLVDLHIEVKSSITVKEGHDIAHQVKDALIHQIPDIRDVQIHVEPYLS